MNWSVNIPQPSACAFAATISVSAIRKVFISSSPCWRQQIAGLSRLPQVVIADVTRPDIIEKILEHVARQQAPPDFSAISSVATVHWNSATSGVSRVVSKISDFRTNHRACARAATPTISRSRRSISPTNSIIASASLRSHAIRSPIHQQVVYASYPRIQCADRKPPASLVFVRLPSPGNPPRPSRMHAERLDGDRQAMALRLLNPSARSYCLTTPVGAPSMQPPSRLHASAP